MVRIKVSQQLTHEAGSAVVLPAFSGDHRVRRADGTEGRVPGIGLLLSIGIGMRVIHYVRAFYGKFRNLAQIETPVHTGHQGQIRGPGIAHRVHQRLHAHAGKGHGFVTIAILRIVGIGDSTGR